MAESTFERYLDRLDAARMVAAGEIGRDDLIAAVRRLDSAVAAIDGRGFEPTPFGPQPELAAAAGLPGLEMPVSQEVQAGSAEWEGSTGLAGPGGQGGHGGHRSGGDQAGAELWVKDETGNVSGSHKARHLFTAALAEELAPSGDGPLAIASCGNAALAAAVVAAALQRELDVYVPTWANDSVVEKIASLGARVIRMPRTPGVLGDPAHHGMVAAVDDGATAFSCQGTDTPTAIDGGRTIAYEMIDEAPGRAGRPVDRLFVQVGGGALGCAVVSGFARILDRAALPVVHAVQPVGNHPLVRAWDTLVAELLAEGGRLAKGSGTQGGTGTTEDGQAGEATPQAETRTGAANASAEYGAPDAAGTGGTAGAERGAEDQAADPGRSGNAWRAAAAAEIGALDAAACRQIVRRLHAEPDRYMRPWPTEPVSVADGILDDVAYDWIPLVEAMLSTAGHPIVCGEDDLRRAHLLGHRHTGIDVSPTGSAGLGGLLTLLRDAPDAVAPGERVAVMFTGRTRKGDPQPAGG